ncbi:MAG: MFS transporter [Candidatus Pacearchaeota archaeon]|nr:MFS transporter [Candidatus Pacearchaeota archaeon]
MGRKKEEIVIEESPYVVHSKEKALNLSIAEGSMQSVARNLGGNFITPFALSIGGNSFHIGLLSSISGLVNPLGQLRGSRLMEKFSRKKILMGTQSGQIIVYLFIISLAYLFRKDFLVSYLPYFLIVFWGIILHYFFGVGHVSWLSWIGDLVPYKEKGKYFAQRNRIIGFVGIIAFLIGAFVLDIFRTRGFVLFGFTILFGVSVIFRMFGRNLTGRIFNPKFRVGKGYYFTFKDFVKRYDNYGKFAFFQAFFFFSLMLSAPFFAVYMLEDLGFNYVMFTAVAMSSVVFYLVFTPLAGKFSDKYGNIKLLYIAGVLFPFVPLLWVFLEKPMALILFPGLISGIANAAYIIGITDFSYDAVSPQKRGLCFAYTGILVGLGTLGGSLIGGFLIQYSGITFINPIFFVFLLSMVFMIMTALFFLPQIKDERKTDRIRGLSVDLSHPFKMIESDVVWFKNFIYKK